MGICSFKDLVHGVVGKGMWVCPDHGCHSQVVVVGSHNQAFIAEISCLAGALSCEILSGVPGYWCACWCLFCGLYA